MKSKYLLPVLLLSYISKGAVCQTQTTYLAGNITDTTILNHWEKPEMLIRIHDPALQLNNSEEMITVPVQPDGSYHVSLKTAQRCYLSFWAAHKNSGAEGSVFLKNLPTKDSDLSQPYLFEAGDSIKADFKNNGLIQFSAMGAKKLFSGKGADKLNCQYQLYQINARPPVILTRINQLSNSGEYPQALELALQSLQSGTRLQTQILETYKGKIPGPVYQQIALNATAHAKLSFLRPLWFSALGSEEKQLAVQQCFNQFRQLEQDQKIDPQTQAASLLHLELLFEKQWNAHKLFAKNLKTGDSFQEVYEGIKNNYPSPLSDQLLLICFKKLHEYFPTQSMQYADSAMTILTKPDQLVALKTWKAKLTVAYPFELEDEKGKIHKLSDYKGKVVVVDFWFTGCSWCRYLNAAMHSVMEQYIDKSDIVFITISWDKNKAVWLNSIASGKYTSPGTINLYTGGLGSRHPMLAYYNFISAPQQLIIGKDGELISAAPPRPGAPASAYTKLNADAALQPNPGATLSAANTIAFMKILEEQLIKTE